LPRTTVLSSLGAIRIQQLSHHNLSSALAFSTFTFTVCLGLICFKVPFENERRPRWCGPGDICMPPSCTPTPVFRPKGPELLHFPHCGRRRTKCGGGTVAIERPDTTACRPWAMKKHSQKYSRRRQSRNESRETNPTTIAFMPHNSNKIT
jgi:hypothetical protein